MVRYDLRVLNRLVDTYENSLLSTGENKRVTNIDMRFLKKNMPEYYDESSPEYETIHDMMKQLEQKDYLVIVWKDNRIDHMIERVRLNPEALDAVYQYLNRKPKRQQEQTVLELLESWITEESPVAHAFACYLRERLEHHQSVKEYIDINDLKDVRLLLEVVSAVEKNVTECYIREFSIEHFHDSKLFEQIKGRVVKVFQRFSEETKVLDESELLAEYGIYHTPNYVYFKGDMELVLGEQNAPLCLGSLKQGIGISGEDLQQLEYKDLSRIKRVITIENLTTFFRLQEPESLIIYLGGYHNHVRRSLLQKLYKELPNVKYYHFGDIDAGGFAILKHLRNRTGIPFEMYCMGLDTLIEYECYGKKLTDTDKKRLQEMSDDEELKDVIGYMLNHNVKLEQECIFSLI